MVVNGVVVKVLDLFLVCLVYFGDKVMEYVNICG